MKSKVISIVLIIGLIAILGGAFVLYNYLGKQVEVNVMIPSKNEIIYCIKFSLSNLIN